HACPIPAQWRQAGPSETDVIEQASFSPILVEQCGVHLHSATSGYCAHIQLRSPAGERRLGAAANQGRGRCSTTLHTMLPCRVPPRVGGSSPHLAAPHVVRSALYLLARFRLEPDDRCVIGSRMSMRTNCYAHVSWPDTLCLSHT